MTKTSHILVAIGFQAQKCKWRRAADDHMVNYNKKAVSGWLRLPQPVVSCIDICKPQARTVKAVCMSHKGWLKQWSTAQAMIDSKWHFLLSAPEYLSVRKFMFCFCLFVDRQWLNKRSHRYTLLNRNLIGMHHCNCCIFL